MDSTFSIRVQEDNDNTEVHWIITKETYFGPNIEILYVIFVLSFILKILNKFHLSNTKKTDLILLQHLQQT